MHSSDGSFQLGLKIVSENVVPVRIPNRCQIASLFLTKRLMKNVEQKYTNTMECHRMWSRCTRMYKKHMEGVKKDFQDRNLSYGIGIVSFTTLTFLFINF